MALHHCCSALVRQQEQIAAAPALQAFRAASTLKPLTLSASTKDIAGLLIRARAAADMVPRAVILAFVALGVAVASAADSTATSQISASTPTWDQMQKNWMGLNLVTQGSDNSDSGPLLSAMESFGSGLEQGLTSLKTAVSSYNDSQAQELLASFDAEFCTDAMFTASSEKPLNFTGPSASLTFSWGNCTFNESQFLDSSEATKILNCTEPSIVYDKDPAIFTSKYKTGDSFTGKSCVVDKDFGSDSTQVLYVFDDSQSLDILNITSTLEQHIADLMDTSSWMPSSDSIEDAITSLLPSAASSSAASST